MHYIRDKLGVKNMLRISHAFAVLKLRRKVEIQTKEIYGKMKRYCGGNGFVYVDNDNINEKNLNKILLHFN